MIKSRDTSLNADGEQNDRAKTEKMDETVKERPSKKNRKKEKEPVEKASIRSRIERRLLVLPLEASVIAIILLVLLGAFYVVTLLFFFPIL
jgi:dolichyl-diphosphooligosaccharide--protein glycosyltransferase